MGEVDQYSLFTGNPFVDWHARRVLPEPIEGAPGQLTIAASGIWANDAKASKLPTLAEVTAKKTVKPVLPTAAPKKAADNPRLPKPKTRDDTSYMERIAKQASNDNLRAIYGVDIPSDSVFVQLLRTAQSRGLVYRAARRKTDEPSQISNAHALERKYSSPTTGELNPSHSKVDGKLTAEKLATHVVVNGGRIIDCGDTKSEITLQCEKGHKMTMPLYAAALEWCAICEYTAAFARNPHVPPPKCDVSEYSTFHYRVSLPFTCHKGHKFTVSPTETQIGECTVCQIENMYAALGAHIRIVGGAYTHPNSLLRAQCLDCFAEFYILPSCEPSRCSLRHRPMEQYGAFLVLVVRIMETLYNTRFDDPTPYQWDRFDAYSARLGICVTINGDEFRNGNNAESMHAYSSCVGFIDVCLTAMSSTDREVVLDVINALALYIEPFNRFSNETKMQFANKVYDLMSSLENANYDFPTRAHARTMKD